MGLAWSIGKGKKGRLRWVISIFFFQNTMKQGTSVKFFELKKKW